MVEILNNLSGLVMEISENELDQEYGGSQATYIKISVWIYMRLTSIQKRSKVIEQHDLLLRYCI